MGASGLEQPCMRLMQAVSTHRNLSVMQYSATVMSIANQLSLPSVRPTILVASLSQSSDSSCKLTGGRVKGRWQRGTP